MMPVIASHIPDGTSCRTYEHFLQTHKSGKFRQFDFGRSKNLRVYGTTKPPEYDLQKSTFPVGIFYGENDACIPPMVCFKYFLFYSSRLIYLSFQDIQILAKKLPNVQVLHRVNWPNFNHVGFIFAKDANKLLNSYVLDLISKNL
jgi:lysosomal acid lipase/cholesteryl ester hydrolase